MTVSLNGKVIGTAAFSPKLQTTHRRKLLQLGLLTSLFNIPLTIPLGTPAGLQVSYNSPYYSAPARGIVCLFPVLSIWETSVIGHAILHACHQPLVFSGKKIVIPLPAMCTWSDYCFLLYSN